MILFQSLSGPKQFFSFFFSFLCNSLLLDFSLVVRTFDYPFFLKLGFLQPPCPWVPPFCWAGFTGASSVWIHKARGLRRAHTWLNALLLLLAPHLTLMFSGRQPPLSDLCPLSEPLSPSMLDTLRSTPLLPRT